MAEILWLLSKLDLRSIIDIVLVASIIYGTLLLLRGTQAVQLLRGVILLALIVALFGSVAQLTAFNWLLEKGSQALLVVVAVVLQPELRRALDRLGRAGGMALWSTHEFEMEEVIEDLVESCGQLSERRHGALIVIEWETGLQDHIETGVEIDALVSAELLQTIFFPNTALHDGAVIIREDRIVAAACVLPLAEMVPSEMHLGTRHRAAMGITEQTDAVAIVISEETGIISLARNGRIIRYLDRERLATLLRAFLISGHVERRQEKEKAKAA